MDFKSNISLSKNVSERYSSSVSSAEKDARINFVGYTMVSRAGDTYFYRTDEIAVE